MDLVPKKAGDNSEWVVIIGSAGAVGSFAVQVYLLFANLYGFDLMIVQIAHLCGYKVLAACSPSAIKVNISSRIL
jgi:NADPH-dependent curcumin reductase CurA